MRDLVTEKLMAVLWVEQLCAALEKEYIDNTLINGLRAKKISMIEEAKTVKEIDLITHPTPVAWNGNGFTREEHVTAKEECLGWMRASLRAPLTTEGVERYMSVFKELFPSKTASIDC